MFDKFHYVDLKRYQTEEQIIEEAKEVFIEEAAIVESVINDNEQIETPIIPKDVDVPQNTLDIESEILRHNQETERILSQIRDALRDVELQQNSFFNEFGAQCFRFVISVSRKIFGNQSFAYVFIDVLQKRVSEIIEKFRKNSVLNISIPTFNEDMREKLISTIKSTADKLNIEIKENASASKNVELHWEHGKADIDIEGAIDAIEEQVNKIDIKE